MIWLAAALAQTPDRVEHWRGQVDWNAAGDEVAAWLSAYLTIDTVAPPGNERDGAVYLQEVLREQGIPSTLYEHGDNRASLSARLKGDGSGGGPVCLLSHIDVVPSELEHWSFPPLSGAIEDGYVYGRGALDMKGMGVVELATLVWLERLQVPLTRDVVLIAVADEEVENQGMRELIATHWDTLGCEVLINEGGLGIPDALLDGQTVHVISTAEKGTLWVRMIATGQVGHGSRVAPDEAPNRLLEAMALLERKYRVDHTLGPEIVELLRRVGDHRGGLYRLVLQSRPLRNLLVKPKVMARPATRAVLTDTLHLTGTGGASSVNVVPSEVWAQYDCRVRPGTSPEAQLARLKRITAGLEGIRWEVLQAYPANRDSWQDPFFDTIAHYAVEDRPDHVAGPVLSPGFTDSIFARDAGTRSFGYVPFVLDEAEANTMHGHDERVSVENLREGTRRLFSMIADFASR